MLYRIQWASLQKLEPPPLTYFTNNHRLQLIFSEIHFVVALQTGTLKS